MDTQTFNQAKKLIQQFEGFSPQVYTCAGGFPTIGYGHRLQPYKVLPEYMRSPITKAEAEHLLEQDMHLSAQAMARLITVPLTHNQWIALVSFTFNLGAAALQRSTLRSKVNRNEHAEVPREFLKWIFARGQKCPSLIRRRQMEANIYQEKGEIK